ncbi:MAG: tetratricopeptide repeat protein [Thermodesulfobacteriota bacterium]|nr:tetratricopeptide repeat protein [Thermodesulfobacteriota bacterium]
MVLLIALWLAPWHVAAADNCEEAATWYHEGLALGDNSEREAAYYEKAIELCPDYFEAHNRLGEIYTAWGAYERAIEEFKKAGRKPSFVEAYYNLGEVYRMQGRYDLAAEAFVKAVRIRPDFREAHNQLKYVYKRLGKYDFVMDTPPETIPISIFTRIPGMTLPKGTFLLDLQYRFWEQEAGLNEDMFVGEMPPLFAAPSKRRIDVKTWVLGIRYGLTHDLTIGLIPKFFSRTAEVPVEFWSIDAEPAVTGFGDTVLLTKYRLWGRGRTHLSVYNLLSIPTGDEDAEADDDQIARRIPLGSGGYDFTPGIAFTTVKEPFTIHAGISYVFTESRQAGDEFYADLAVLLPRFHGFIGIAELNYRWRDSAKRSQLFQTRFGFQPGPGMSDVEPGPWTVESILKEPGGYILFLSPGVQIPLAKGLEAELGLQIPIIRSGHDWKEEIVFHMGMRKYFF